MIIVDLDSVKKGVVSESVKHFLGRKMKSVGGIVVPETAFVFFSSDKARTAFRKADIPRLKFFAFRQGKTVREVIDGMIREIDDVASKNGIPATGRFVRKKAHMVITDRELDYVQKVDAITMNPNMLVSIMGGEMIRSHGGNN